MALISPILDNRTYAQLREELIRRIPVYTPGWTNHNESDPGIALLELFAYLGESLLYRFNQIPDTARVEFLRMLGVQPRPAQPAQVLLVATTDVAGGVQVLKGSEARAGSVPFETEDEVYVWPIEILAAGKTPAREPELPNLTKAEKESRADALARAGIDPSKAKFYTTTVVSAADPLEAEPTVVDVSAQVDGALWIALLSKPTTDTVALGGRTVFVGVAFDETIEPPIVLDQLDATEANMFRSDELTSSPPPMQWRLWKGAQARAGDAFQELHVLGDTTQGMVTSGVVKVELPSTLPALKRATGGEDSPPPLSDAKLAARVIAWIQVSRPPSSEIGDAIGSVRWVGINAVSAVQARTATPELVGTGTGDADQRYALTQHPVLARSVELQVEEPDGWTTWQEVDNFVASTPDDRHFMVDPDAGAVSFGRARVPQIGERIRVLSYRYGGGAVGNVAAGAVNALSGASGVKVSNPLPAVGGGDRVDLAEAMDAIPAEVHRRDRAVVVDDFRDLAQEVPGVKRAEALPFLHPDTPTTVAAGVVSLVVFPEGDLRNPGAPLPELGLLRRVARHLDARRLVTTELYVIPPEYMKVSLSVGLRVRDGYQVDAVRRWVELILRQYLAPLPPYGPDGKGWPLGRAIRRAELEAVAVQVEGVEYLEGLLLGPAEPSDVERQLIPLQRWQVPELAEITVVAGAPVPLERPSTPPRPDPVPVWLAPDVC